jgi:hypothetical protein
LYKDTEFFSNFISQFSNFSSRQASLAFATSALQAQRLNMAVLNYDFIFLMIGVVATLLFVFETLYRVYQVYVTTNGTGRSITGWSTKNQKRKKRHFVLKPDSVDHYHHCGELCQRVNQLIASYHEMKFFHE